MGLRQLTDSVYYLPHQPETDRPMLAYVKGEALSLAIDAGYSQAHVRDFYEALKEKNLAAPDFTVITHWHYDHTFGMHALQGISIAHQKTNRFLAEQQRLAQDKRYISALKRDDVHFAREYEHQDALSIVLSDIEFTRDMTVNLGSAAAHIFHTVSPHSDDAVCVYIPEEKVLFLGDSTSEDYFNHGYMDEDKRDALTGMIERTDCMYCVLSHCDPLRKEELLSYLYSAR